MRLAFFFVPISEFIAQFIHPQHIQFQIHHKDKNRTSVFQQLYSANQIIYINEKLIFRGICYSFHVELGSFRVRTTWIHVETVLFDMNAWTWRRIT